MHEPDGSEQGLAGQAVLGPEVVPQVSFSFVGSRRLFSEVVLRTIETEFAGVRATRCPDLATCSLVFASHGQPGHPPLRLLIVDERQAADLVLFVKRRDALTREVNLAIAVREDSGASELMARWGVLLSAAGVSILPMNLHLNAWIQVIRLLDCGGRYLPTCVYDGGRRGDPGMPALPGNVVALHQAEPAGPEAGPDCAATAGAVARLTPREREVLTLVAAGRPNKVIANELSVSAHTVKLHIHRIMAKLGVSNRTEAAICFHHRDG